MPHPLNIQTLEAPSGLTVYHLGPSLENGPLPAFFYFALSGQDSLNLDPFNQPVQYLANSGIRVFSFTIPGHGEGLENTKAMEFWANALGNNNDIIASFIEQCNENISYLMSQDLIDPQFLATGGLSRGGFIATHLAAKNPSVKTVLGFAPLTKLSDLDAFRDIMDQPLISTLNLEKLIPELIHKQVRYYIGNRDTLVNTDSCYHLVRNIANAAYDKKVRSPTVELIITPSIGHRGHGTTPHVFKEGIEWLKSIVKPSKEDIRNVN